MAFREHQVRLYLDKELYLASINFQAKEHLGPAYAGLLAYIEGLHQLGFINDDVYERHRKKYSVPLTEPEGQVLPKTREQLGEEIRLANLEKEFKMALDQWHLHPSLEWRLKWFKKAEQNKDMIPSAKRLVELYESKGPPVDDKLERALGHD
jgi:hypothetical protein